MPTPQADESEDDFMARCIPEVLAEGVADDASQAAAICASYWDERGQAMKYERRDITVPVEVRELEDGTPQMVGYAIRYNQPSVDMGFTEYVAPGAARSATMDGADVLALWSHDTSQVLGRTTANTLRLTEDERGVLAEINPPAWAGNYVETVRRGDVKGMSFGFRVLKDSVTEMDDGSLVRTLEDLEVLEVSPVAMPAYPSTSVDARQLRERVLADRGMTEAQRIRIGIKRRAIEKEAD